MNCEWCDEQPRMDGSRFCSRKCMGEARWEGKRIIPRALVKRLYVFEHMSTPAIAKKLGVNPEGVRYALRSSGVELRTHTSVRTCWCGKPSFKLITKNCLSGTLCVDHLKERWHKSYLAKKAKKLYTATQVLEGEAELHKPIFEHQGSSSTATL